MPAGFALFVLFVLFAIAMSLGLWLLTDAETSNPTVLDREEAERRAMDRGGRRVSSLGAERGRDERGRENGWERRDE